MGTHIPDTDEVRRFFVNGKSEEMYCASWIDDYADEFDKWLAMHDAEVHVGAVRVAAAYLAATMDDHHKAVHLFRDYADKIARGEQA